MVHPDFLLASSLKALLIHDFNNSVELRDTQPLTEYIDSGELKRHWVHIALMKWEIHHGFYLPLEQAIDLSIQQLIPFAKDRMFTCKYSYMEHVLQRYKVIDAIYEDHVWDGSEFDEEEFDRALYLNNKN